MAPRGQWRSRVLGCKEEEKRAALAVGGDPGGTLSQHPLSCWKMYRAWGWKMYRRLLGAGQAARRCLLQDGIWQVVYIWQHCHL